MKKPYYNTAADLLVVAHKLSKKGNKKSALLCVEAALELEDDMASLAEGMSEMNACSEDDSLFEDELNDAEEKSDDLEECNTDESEDDLQECDEDSCDVLDEDELENEDFLYDDLDDELKDELDDVYLEAKLENLI